MGTRFSRINYACSGNGTYLARLVGGVITISTNGGTSFPVTVTAPAAGVTCLGASSDCTRLVAGVNNGLLYASSNQGETWTSLTSTESVLVRCVDVAGRQQVCRDRQQSLAARDGGVYDCNVSALPNTISTTCTGSIVRQPGIGGGTPIHRQRAVHARQFDGTHLGELKIAQLVLNFPDWRRNFFGFEKITRSIAPARCPRFFISNAVFGTASGSLTPQSHALFIQSRSLP